MLEIPKEKIEQDFKIISTPDSEASLVDMQAQFDFITDVNATVDKAHKSIKNIRVFNEKLSAFQQLYKDDERKDVTAMVDSAKAMSKKFGEIEKALYQTQNRSGQDPLNFPIRLTNKLAHLNSLATVGDFRPTDQSIAVKNELTAAIEKELAVFDAALEKDITAFNRQFNALQLDYLQVEKE
jgi:hypothetical protein